MKTISVEKRGINPGRGGYDHLVAAGTYHISKQRVNAAGYGIIVSSTDGQKLHARTMGDACRAVREDVVKYATKIVGEKASVLVVWRIAT